MLHSTDLFTQQQNTLKSESKIESSKTWSDVRWKEAVGNLNGVKPNESIVKGRYVKFKWEKVNCREVEWSVVGWSLNAKKWIVVKWSEV